MSSIIKTVNLSKSFFLKKNLNILKKINIEIKKGELIALLGPSGSGKSTFLHLIALLDQPSNGEIYFEGKKTSEMNDVEKDEVRGKKISIVYQQNNLLSDFTSLEKGRLEGALVICSATNSTNSGSTRCNARNKIEHRYIIQIDRSLNILIYKYNLKKDKWILQ